MFTDDLKNINENWYFDSRATSHQGCQTDVMRPFCGGHHVVVCPNDASIASMSTDVRKSLFTLELPLLQLATENRFWFPILQG
jgi:hypothetical protein